MSYEGYKNARNESWNTIIFYKISRLPVMVKELCAIMRIPAISYEKGQHIIERYNLHMEIEKNEGISFLVDGLPVILYDSNIKPYGRLRFTVAHEIGHHALRHLRDDNPACRQGVTLWNRGEDTPPNAFETQANIYASRILAPACVLWALNAHSAKEISALCGLSMKAAAVRAERMAELYERERFFTSDREVKAFMQFIDFIVEKTGKSQGFWLSEIEHLKNKNR